MTEEEKIKFVQEKLTANEILIQLAEECNELAQACLKIVRWGTPNLPNKTAKELDSDFMEELADVQLCMEMLPEFVIEETEINEIKEYKLNRWVQRLNGDYSDEKENKTAEARVEYYQAKTRVLFKMLRERMHE